MITKGKIRRILLESTNRLMDRFAEGVIKFKYKEIYNHNLGHRLYYKKILNQITRIDNQ